ncbi:ribonuclease H-like domain-containing protein [Tanacetum coccineum]
MSGTQDENPPPPPPQPTQQQTPTQQTPHTVSTIKLPILKKGEYDIWAMKLEHYLAHTDYPIWEVIQNGNGPVSVTTDTSGQIKILPPKTGEEVVARERERKARTTLLMAIPEDHLAKFHKRTNAKKCECYQIKIWDGIHNAIEISSPLQSARDSWSRNKPDRYGEFELLENEVFQSVFKSNKGDFENPPLHKRIDKTCEMQAVPPPMTGNYLPSGPDIEIDDSQYPKWSQKRLQPMSEPVVNESNIEVQPKLWSDAPIIEEYESDSDDECHDREQAYLADFKTLMVACCQFGESEYQANIHASTRISPKCSTRAKIVLWDSEKEVETDPRLLRTANMAFLFFHKKGVQERKNKKKSLNKKPENLVTQAGAAKSSSTNIFSTVSTTAKASGTNLVNTVSIPVSTASTDSTNSQEDDSEIPPLEDIHEDVTDEYLYTYHLIYEALILGDPTSAVQTRSKVNKSSEAHAFVSYVQKQRRNNHKDFHHCLFACFLSQHEPKKISEALEDESWVDAMQEELLQFEIHKIDEEVYVSQPPGFQDPKYPKKVYKVVKALYGLTSSTKAWIYDEDRLSTEDGVSTVKEGVSTDFEKVSTDSQKVSTDSQKVSTDGSKVSTDEQVEGTEETNEGSEEIFESTEEQREGTEEKVESTAGQIEGTEDQTKEEIASQTSTQTPTSMTFGDDETIATLLLNMSKDKAASKEKEKGVELKDVEDIDRPRPTSTRSLLTLKPLPKIDPKDKGKKKIEEEDESESEDDDIPQAVKKFKQLESDEELARKIQEDWEAEEVKT